MRVVARTNRGLEVGEVLCEATEEALAQMPPGSGGQIVRPFTSSDANELTHLTSRERHDFQKCCEHVRRLELPMDLVDIEHLFGGERILIYYVSEERVDFRELVKALAAEFQTRIEMRQIGVRDEAKLLGDYGDCGKPLCCNTHLAQMPPVSMKMAKLQKATLDPTKISGRCGRLKCCLRYEFDTYEELQRDMPAVGADVVTTQGRAHVIGQEILSQQLLVVMEDQRRLLIPVADVLTVLSQGSNANAGDRRERRDHQRRDHERREHDSSRTSPATPALPQSEEPPSADPT
jgi:cell fate regulator YaaT (PSP1 superfamily)